MSVLFCIECLKVIFNLLIILRYIVCIKKQKVFPKASLNELP